MVEFDYSQNGRDWPRQFPTCGNGRDQSPIDIRYAFQANCSERSTRIEFQRAVETARVSGARSDFSTEMNTSTVTITKSGNSANYRLTEFHIHSPSEHKINGRQFDAEMHFSYVLTGGQRPAGDNRD